MWVVWLCVWVYIQHFSSWHEGSQIKRHAWWELAHLLFCWWSCSKISWWESNDRYIWKWIGDCGYMKIISCIHKEPMERLSKGEAISNKNLEGDCSNFAYGCGNHHRPALFACDLQMCQSQSTNREKAHYRVAKGKCSLSKRRSQRHTSEIRIRTNMQIRVLQEKMKATLNVPLRWCNCKKSVRKILVS